MSKIDQTKKDILINFVPKVIEVFGFLLSLSVVLYEDGETEDRLQTPYYSHRWLLRDESRDLNLIVGMSVTSIATTPNFQLEAFRGEIPKYIPVGFRSSTLDKHKFSSYQDYVKVDEMEERIVSLLGLFEGDKIREV